MWEESDTIRTYDFGDRSAFAKTNVDHCKSWRRLTEPGEKRLELLRRAEVVVMHQLKKASLIVVNGDPERESAEDLKVLVGKIFRNGLGERLGSLTSSGLSLDKQGLWKHVLVAINNAKNKGALVLQIPVKPEICNPRTSRTHGP